MSDCPLDSSNLLFALLETQNTSLPTLSSEVIPTNSVSTAVISGLKQYNSSACSSECDELQTVFFLMFLH